MGAGAWRPVDQLEAAGGQIAQDSGEVVDPVGDVVKAGAPPVEEPGDRGVGTGRLDQLETAAGLTHEDDVDTLGGDRFRSGTAGA